MDADWKERLLRAIDEDGRSDRAISLSAGLGPNFIGQMRGTKSAAAKKPNIEYVKKLAKALGKELSSIIGTPADEAEGILRSALIAYGVDRDELDQVLKIIGTYVSDDEPPEQTSPKPQPASRPHEPAPSRKRSERSGV